MIKTLAAGGVGVGVNAAAPYIIREQPGFSLNTSYWSLALPEKSPAPARDIECDVAILGGGFTGLSTAFYVRQTLPAARVIVLEAERCGNGASGRNGAMLMNLTSDSYFDTGRDAALYERLYRLTLDNVHRIDALSKRFGMDCDLDLHGTLMTGDNQADADQFAEVAAAAQRRGVPMQLWNADRVRDAIGSRAYSCAVFEPNSGQLHPGKLVGLWKMAAQSSGAVIYEGSAVRHIETGARLRLELDNGRTVQAARVVLATNAYTSKLGYLRNALIPVINHVAITEPIPAELLDRAGWRRRIPFSDNRLRTTYLGLTREGRIHIGGDTEQYQFNNGVHPPQADVAVARLRADFERLYPELIQIPFERHWWGLVDMSADQTPAVGRLTSNENIYYAVGLSGQGVNLTSVLGRILGDLIAGNGAQWSWFPYLNRVPPYLPNEPLRWLGFRAVMALTH
jgi:glycine/D-amino acid oxidase-like deaminating enzyme